MSKEECCTCSDRLNYVKLCEKYDQLESVHEVLVEDNLTYENQIADLEAKLAECERLKETHPKIYEYCIGGGEFVDGIWQPNRKGLGLGYVMDYINNLYGKKMLRY